MIPNTDAATRRIMDRLGADTRLPYLNVEEGDAGVLIGAPLCCLIVVGVLGLEAVALPLALASLFVGAGIVFVAPAHLSAWTWLKRLGAFLWAPRRVYHAPGDRDHEQASSEASQTVETYTRNAGGLSNWTPWKPTERVEDLLGIERAWPENSALERTDGTVQGFIEVTPGNMDFAMADDWASLQASAEAFTTTDLDFGLTLHATTRPFPVEQLTQRLEARLDDPDVTANPVFETLLEEYRRTRPTEMRDRGTQQLHYYLGVSVGPLDVYERDTTAATPAERLTDLPGIGFLFTPFVTRRDDLTTAERRERQFEVLDERLRTIQTRLVDTMSGWSARRLDTAELVALTAGFWTDQTPESDAIDRRLPTEGHLETGGQPSADHVADQQRSLMAPASLDLETRTARLDEQWTTTLVATAFPDYPSDGYLSDLFERTDVRFDLTVQVTPRPQAQAREQLRETAENLQADADLERSARGAYLEERAAEAAATYQAVERGQQVFEHSLLVTVRADSRDELTEAVRRVRRTLQDDPANLTVKPAICDQRRALQAAAPTTPTRYGRSAIALGGAVGALLASLHTPTILEDGGVEVGSHEVTRSPIVVDPFARENGYATFVVGDTGSGKSFSSKQQFLRSIEQREDRIGVILEPLNNWAGVADAVGAKRITVGGTRGLNPLELRPTPAHVMEAMGSDASPLNEKLDDAMSFLANFFALREIDLGDRRTTLELGLREAYERAGITADPATHERASPTLRGMLDIFEEISTDPESFVVRTTDEARKLAADATWLLDQLRPFENGGRYANLGRSSEFDIRDAKMVYLDLAQQEGSAGGATALTMQLLISLVYERAKETEKQVVFYIDEARYLMQDAASLRFLETVFRHHRHHDLSIRLITQTVDEFFEHPESEAILDQCAVKQFHRLEGMDEHWADEFGLNPAQMRFVQSATPGSDATGYSQALIGVDGEWRGIRVQALPEETQIIEGDG